MIHEFIENIQKMKRIILSAMAALFILSGCGSVKNMRPEDRAGVGAQIGSFAGYLFGGLIGYAVDNERGADLGSFVGTAVGGVAGASIAVNSVSDGTVVETDGRPSLQQQQSVPDLKIEDIFLEEDSAISNQKIDAGETCRLTFVIVNNGRRTSGRVEPVVKVEKGKSRLKVSDPVTLPAISTDDRISYTVNVHASDKLRTGKAVFSITLVEEYGYGIEKQKFTVDTQGN